MDSDIRTEQTGAPTDLVGGMPATSGEVAATALDAAERETFAAVADQLIPAAHGMPSAAEIVSDERLGFVLNSRPDLLDPLKLALRAELGPDVALRLARLADEPTNLAALQLAVVGGYYTDRRVREQIGYPGQVAIEVKSWLIPPYIEEGMIDAVMARGAVWRDPRTGSRADDAVPRTYAELFGGGTAATEGEDDGRSGT
jgi:hypothetical protein